MRELLHAVETAGRANDDVYHLSLRKLYKKLGGMQIAIRKLEMGEELEPAELKEIEDLRKRFG